MKVFIKPSNMAGKEIIYYKIKLGLKFNLLWRPVKLKCGFQQQKSGLQRKQH